MVCRGRKNHIPLHNFSPSEYSMALKLRELIRMINNAKECWNDCLELIKSNVDSDQYNAWFANLAFDSYNKETNTLQLQVPSQFTLEYLEEHYLKLLSKVLIRNFGRGIKLTYRILIDKSNNITTTVNQSEAPNQNAPRKTEDLNKAPNIIDAFAELDSQLDANRTFANFIEGSSNKLPRAVGLSIAENTNKTQFNPFFIYGPSGCGKTHLINAIGVKMKEAQPKSRVLYVSARLFQVQFTDSVRHNTFNDFITFYQTIDVLIIDDVQEWITAPRTQEAFFHIFNHLFRNGKRIILACDRPPVDLQGMSERLLTRLKCGLVAELEHPDSQLCKDILKFMIKRDGLSIKTDVIDYIANTANGSVRDLEGIVNALIANSIVYDSDIDIVMAQKVIRSIVRTEKRELTIDDILSKVCDYFHISAEEVAGKSRKQEIVNARQIAMYLADKHTDYSRSHIGRRIANRDHTTVIHSCTKVSEAIKSSKAFASTISQIENYLL